MAEIKDRALRARIRARVRRAAARQEEEEQQGGELNLVPYLDILVNTMIFLLATTATALPLAHVHASSPTTSPKPPVERAGGGGEGLNLTVAVGYQGFIVAGSGGVMRDAGNRLPTVPCVVPLVRRACPANSYDFAELTRLAGKIKDRYPSERRVHITADRNVAYQVVVKTMDALRGSCMDTLSKKRCLFDKVVFAAGVQ